jgi:hypothetical protein
LPSNPFEPGNGTGQAPVGMPGGAANPNQVTTKPRQMPGGGGFDPASNGGDIQLGKDDPAPGDTGGDAPSNSDSPEAAPRVAAIAQEIIRTNPGLAPVTAARLAQRAFDDFLSKEAWTDNPLGQVSWMSVPDGPITERLDPSRRKPKGQGDPQQPRQQGAPEPRDHDEPLGKDEHDAESQHEYHDNYQTLYEQPEHDDEPIDLSEWDKPAERQHPRVRQMVRKYGPEVAKALWMMRKAR